MQVVLLFRSCICTFHYINLTALYNALQSLKRNGAQTKGEILMAARFTLGLRDADKNDAQTSFNVTQALSDGSDYQAITTQVVNLRDAILAVTLGTQQLYTNAQPYNLTNPAAASSAFAQTNIQWQFQYTDDVNGRTFNTRVPTADLGGADVITDPVNGITYLDLSTGTGQTLKQAFEAVVLSEDGNAVTLNNVIYLQ